MPAPEHGGHVASVAAERGVEAAVGARVVGGVAVLAGLLAGRRRRAGRSPRRPTRPSRAARWRIAMRWSVEAPAGTSTAAPAAPAGRLDVAGPVEGEEQGEPAREGCKRGQELEEIWSYRGHVPRWGEGVAAGTAHPPVGERAIPDPGLRQLRRRRLRHGCVLRLGPLGLAVEPVVRERRRTGTAPGAPCRSGRRRHRAGSACRPGWASAAPPRSRGARCRRRHRRADGRSGTRRCRPPGRRSGSGSTPATRPG